MSGINVVKAGTDLAIFNLAREPGHTTPDGAKRHSYDPRSLSPWTTRHYLETGGRGPFRFLALGPPTKDKLAWLANHEKFKFASAKLVVGFDKNTKKYKARLVAKTDLAPGCPVTFEYSSDTNFTIPKRKITHQSTKRKKRDWAPNKDKVSGRFLPVPHKRRDIIKPYCTQRSAHSKVNGRFLPKRKPITDKVPDPTREERAARRSTT